MFRVTRSCVWLSVLRPIPGVAPCFASRREYCDKKFPFTITDAHKIKIPTDEELGMAETDTESDLENPNAGVSG